MTDDYRQKLERILAWKVVLFDLEQNANVQTNIFETEQVVRQSVKPNTAAVSLAMSTPAGFPFRLEVNQSLLEAIKISRSLCQMGSDNTLHESCWWFKTLFGVFAPVVKHPVRLVVMCLLSPSSFSLRTPTNKYLPFKRASDSVFGSFGQLGRIHFILAKNPAFQPESYRAEY